MKRHRIVRIFALAACLALAAAATRAQTGGAGAPPSAAEEALKKLNAELKAKSQTMSMMEYTGYAEKALNDFLKKYPRGPEAAQAHFALGRLYTSIGSVEDSVRELTAFLSSPGAKSTPQMIAQARYVIGTDYMQLGRYEDAERVFKELTAGGSSVDSRISQAAAGELERIPALRKLRVGAPAPAISAKSHQGKKISIPKGYQGKVVLLDFWAAWCNPCRMEMPNVIKVYNDYHAKGFEIVGISLDKDKAEFETYLRDNKLPWEMLYDGKYWQSDYAKLYAVNSIPATYLLDRKGVIRFKNVRGDQLRAAVQQLLTEK